VPLSLKPGVRLYLEIEAADEGGYRLTVGQRVGARDKPLSRKTVESEEHLWLAIARWAGDRLARLGLEKVR
jgi:hypothetical protein